MIIFHRQNPQKLATAAQPRTTLQFENTPMKLKQRQLGKDYLKRLLKRQGVSQEGGLSSRTIKTRFIPSAAQPLSSEFDGKPLAGKYQTQVVRRSETHKSGTTAQPSLHPATRINLLESPKPANMTNRSQTQKAPTETVVVSKQGTAQTTLDVGSAGGPAMTELQEEEPSTKKMVNLINRNTRVLQLARNINSQQNFMSLLKSKVNQRQNLKQLRSLSQKDRQQLHEAINSGDEGSNESIPANVKESARSKGSLKSPRVLSERAKQELTIPGLWRYLSGEAADRPAVILSNRDSRIKKTLKNLDIDQIEGEISKSKSVLPYVDGHKSACHNRPINLLYGNSGLNYRRKMAGTKSGGGDARHLYTSSGQYAKRGQASSNLKNFRIMENDSNPARLLDRALGESSMSLVHQASSPNHNNLSFPFSKDGNKSVVSHAAKDPLVKIDESTQNLMVGGSLISRDIKSQQEGPSDFVDKAKPNQAMLRTKLQGRPRTNYMSRPPQPLPIAPEYKIPHFNQQNSMPLATQSAVTSGNRSKVSWLLKCTFAHSTSQGRKSQRGATDSNIPKFQALIGCGGQSSPDGSNGHEGSYPRTLLSLEQPEDPTDSKNMFAKSPYSPSFNHDHTIRLREEPVVQSNRPWKRQMKTLLARYQRSQFDEERLKKEILQQEMDQLAKDSHVQREIPVNGLERLQHKKEKQTNHVRQQIALLKTQTSQHAKKFKRGVRNNIKSKTSIQASPEKLYTAGRTINIDLANDQLQDFSTSVVQRGGSDMQAGIFNEPSASAYEKTSRTAGSKMGSKLESKQKQRSMTKEHTISMLESMPPTTSNNQSRNYSRASSQAEMENMITTNMEEIYAAANLLNLKQIGLADDDESLTPRDNHPSSMAHSSITQQTQLFLQPKEPRKLKSRPDQKGEESVNEDVTPNPDEPKQKIECFKTMDQNPSEGHSQSQSKNASEIIHKNLTNEGYQGGSMTTSSQPQIVAIVRDESRRILEEPKLSPRGGVVDPTPNTKLNERGGIALEMQQINVDY